MGTTRSFPDPIVRKLLKIYSNAHPNVHYELFERSSSSLISALDDGIIEFAAIRGVRQLPDFVNVVASFNEHFCVLCAEDSDFLPKNTDTIELTDLINKPLSISYSFRSYIQERCREYGFAPIIHSMNPSRSTLLQWAEFDQALAVLPLSNDSSAPSHLRCYKIKGNPLSSKRLFVTKKGRKLSPPAAHLVETVYTMFPPL